MVSLPRIMLLIPALMVIFPALAMDWNKVEAAMGRTETVLPGGVHRFGMPRNDLHVTLGDVTIRPALALGAWAAFHPVGAGEAMVMGDLVVTVDEVAPVMKVLGEGGVAVTALHNHLVGEQPNIMYIHMGGHGDPVAMARTIKAAIDLTGTPPPAPAAAEPADLGFDTGAVGEIIGRQGSVSGGVLHIGVPRAETLRVEGMIVPPAMGAGTAINFQPLGGGRAVAYGDFALAGREVESAMATLRTHGIETMALHNHMLGDEPRLFYIHFWGEGDALALARGLKAALGETNAVVAAAATRVTFDDAAPGAVPPDWSCGVTGRGAPVWKVEEDGTAPSRPNVLKQSGSGAFPWCAKTGVALADGFAEVKFKPLAGREDQAGGLVWRFQGGDNYYVTRANALENNVSLYYTANGRRHTIKYVDAPVAGDQWHTLRVEFAGGAIKVFLDGKQYIDLEDTHITGAGAVGLWTKADSVTAFDDFAFGGK